MVQSGRQGRLWLVRRLCRPAFDKAGIEMNKEYRARNAPPLADGSVRGTPGLPDQALRRLSEPQPPQQPAPPGYYIIYGKGSTPTPCRPDYCGKGHGEGVYLLETVGATQIRASNATATFMTAWLSARTATSGPSRMKCKPGRMSSTMSMSRILYQCLWADLVLTATKAEVTSSGNP